MIVRLIGSLTKELGLAVCEVFCFQAKGMEHSKYAHCRTWRNDPRIAIQQEGQNIHAAVVKEGGLKVATEEFLDKYFDLLRWHLPVECVKGLETYKSKSSSK